LFVTLFWVAIGIAPQSRFSHAVEEAVASCRPDGRPIVGSERARSVKTVHRVFNKAIDFANERYADGIESPLTITLGDEFQGLLRTLSHAWRAAAASPRPAKS
jgi:hypothetical protein